MRALCSLLALALAIVPCNSSRGDQLEELTIKAGLQILSKGESSAESRKGATAAVPLTRMTPAGRQRAQKIIESCTQHRKLPTLQYTIDEPIYRYLLQHPDVAVSTWRVMGISRFEMWQTGAAEYEAKAVDGTEGLADILYQDAEQMVFICEGSYHNVILPRPLEASALVWFRAAYAPNAEGTHVVTQQADVFVRFPSPGISTVAKMLTPVTNNMMDRNLFEISLYSSMMSRAVRDEPEWVVQVADQMDGVLPQRKNELIEVARLPRKIAVNSLPGKGSVTSVDRNVVMSPELQFFDPPKDGTKIVTVEPAIEGQIRTADLATKLNSATSPSASRPMVITPAARATSTRRLSQNIGDKAANAASNFDDAPNPQPAVPPAGSTATDPAGRGATNRPGY